MPLSAHLSLSVVVARDMAPIDRLLSGVFNACSAYSLCLWSSLVDDPDSLLGFTETEIIMLQRPISF